jgi:hypothetical protein
VPIPNDWPPHVQRRAREFLALWKYYRHARTLSEAAAPYYEQRKAGVEHDPLDVMRATTFISYSIASLHILTEGWQHLKLTDSTIDPLLTRDHVATLKNYRHTVFHFQADLDEKRIRALENDIEAVGWVLDLGAAYQDFFDPHTDAIQVERIRAWLFAPARPAV